MSEIVYLNKARKTRARAEAAALAATNRVIFGLTKTQKTVARDRASRETKALDAHKREP